MLHLIIEEFLVRRDHCYVEFKITRNISIPRETFECKRSFKIQIALDKLMNLADTYFFRINIKFIRSN